MIDSEKGLNTVIDRFNWEGQYRSFDFSFPQRSFWSTNLQKVVLPKVASTRNRHFICHITIVILLRIILSQPFISCWFTYSWRFLGWSGDKLSLPYLWSEKYMSALFIFHFSVRCVLPSCKRKKTLRTHACLSFELSRISLSWNVKLMCSCKNHCQHFPHWWLMAK